MNKKFVWSIVSILALGVSVLAQTPQFNTTQYRSAFDKESISVTSAVTSLTASVYNPTTTGAPPNTTRAEFANIECDTHNIRFWATSASPTAGGGILLQVGNILTLQGFHDISNFKAISADGSTAICNVEYSRFSANLP